MRLNEQRKLFEKFSINFFGLFNFESNLQKWKLNFLENPMFFIIVWMINAESIVFNCKKEIKFISKKYKKQFFFSKKKIKKALSVTEKTLISALLTERNNFAIKNMNNIIRFFLFISLVFHNDKTNVIDYHW